MRLSFKIVALIGFTIFNAQAYADDLSDGTWVGQCVRPGHAPSHGRIVIQGGGVTFFGESATNVDFRYPHIGFVTTAGTGHVPREFSGSFINGTQQINGSLLQRQPSQKIADCSFSEQ